MIGLVLLTLLSIGNIVASHQSEGICSKMYAFCKEEMNHDQNEPVIARTGKAGPRGPPGPEGRPGTVNYTRINIETQKMLDGLYLHQLFAK